MMISTTLKSPVVMTTHHAGEIHAYPLRFEDVNVLDVAAALSKLCRFTGHCRDFYSVAEHSLRVCALAEREMLDVGVVHLALLHDAHEAYVGDISTMWKREIQGFSLAETWLQRTTLRALGVSDEWRCDSLHWKRVRELDEIALHSEAAQLFHPVPSWVDRKKALLDETPVQCLDPKRAETLFLEKLEGLGYLGRSS